MGTTMQSLVKIAQCAPALGVKMWCLFFFVCFLFVCHAPSLEHRVFDGCIVRTSIALPFIGRFRRGFQLFFRRDFSFRCTTQFAYLSLVGATIFAKLRSKIVKIQKKSEEKFVRTTSYRQLRDLKKILLQQFRDKIVDVHLYKNFSTYRYLALTASV